MSSSSSQANASQSPTELLWKNVLRKEIPARPLDLPQPPTAPVDRNATSTRILLYDTQARLEQFSARADKMLKEMDNATHQLKITGALFEKDRDTLTNDIIDLANRCQTEIQKSVGKPVQESQILPFHEKLEIRIEALNQRLDALQMFNQTHNQAIETQSHVLKTIQEQQNALLSAILPLLPAVQAISPKMESLKTCMQEVASAVSLTSDNLKQDLLSQWSTLSRGSAKISTRKRRLSINSIAEPSTIASKKSRVDTPLLANPRNTVNLPQEKDLSKPSPHKLQVYDLISPAHNTNSQNKSRSRSVFATPRMRKISPAIISPHTTFRQRTKSTHIPTPGPPAMHTSTISNTNSPSMNIPIPFTIIPREPGHDIFQNVSRTPFHFSVPYSAHQISPGPITEPKTIAGLQIGNPKLPITQQESQRKNVTVTPLPPKSFPVPEYFQRQPSIIPILNRKMTMLMGTAEAPITASARRQPPKEGRRFISLDDDDDDDDDDDSGDM